MKGRRILVINTTVVIIIMRGKVEAAAAAAAAAVSAAMPPCRHHIKRSAGDTVMRHSASPDIFTVMNIVSFSFFSIFIIL